MQNRMTKRLTKDLEQMQKIYSDLFQVALLNNDLQVWHVKFVGGEGTLFHNEPFIL